MTGRPFRFGAIATRARTGEDWKKLSRRVQRLGFSTLQMSDHFNDQLAPTPALSAAAAVTTTLRVGSLVYCNSFRHPVTLAKEIATLDLLSDGRVEWGMGAGWLELEHESVGIPFESHHARATRLIEAVAIMKELLRGEASHHVGRHYRTAGVVGRPVPVQRPQPPLLVGAASERLLRFAAREADIVGIGPSLATNPVFGTGRVPFEDATDRQLGWIRDAAGARFDALELHMVAFPILVTDDAAARRADIAASQGLPEAEVAASPHVLIGSVGEIVELLEARRDRWGISYWSFPVEQLDLVAPIVDRLAGR